MIRTISQGTYQLIETKSQTKILLLDNRYTFAWVHAGEIGEILIASHKTHKADHVLAIGRYRLYEVEYEPDFTDLLHLELYVGETMWQGYLLPTGLPTDKKKRNRIIPTDEIITRSVLSN